MYFFPSVYLRKLTDDECPLRLRLCAGPSEKSLSLVLRENETGEVNVSLLYNHDNFTNEPCIRNCLKPQEEIPYRKSNE